MRDSEVVAYITAGDPLGLAAAYDRYSGPLFSYCQTLLNEPADAADAVQDTFVIAASKLTTLRDPERLRAWLFSVARNECLHRLRSRQAAPLGAAADRADDSADVSAEAERAEARALIRAAAGGLNAGERDVINQLWHGLEVREVAAVLGVSRNHAYSLFSRALDQLETSVAVLLVGRSGRKDCAALDQLLIGWDGRLTAPLRKRVGRHIDRCAVCSDRRRKTLTPALLFDLSPAAILALALAHRVALPGARLAGLPAGLRGEVLRLATDPGPHAAAYRAGVTRSTGPFHSSGFPKAAHTGHLGLARVAHLPLATAGVTATSATVTMAVTATAVVTAIVPNVHLPSVPGRGIARGPATVHVPSHGPSAAPGSGPASPPPGRLTAGAAQHRTAATDKRHAHQAKKASHPRSPEPGGWTSHGHGNGNGLGDGGYPGSGLGNGNRDSGHGHGHSQGNGNSHGNSQGSGNARGNAHGQGNGNSQGSGNDQGNGHGQGSGHGNSRESGNNGGSDHTLPLTRIVTVSVMPPARVPAARSAVLTGTLGPRPLAIARTLTANGGPVAWSVAGVAAWAASWPASGRHAAGYSRDATHEYRPKHARRDADSAPWRGASDRTAWGSPRALSVQGALGSGPEQYRDWVLLPPKPRILAVIARQQESFLLLSRARGR